MGRERSNVKYEKESPNMLKRIGYLIMIKSQQVKVDKTLDNESR